MQLSVVRNIPAFWLQRENSVPKITVFIPTLPLVLEIGMCTCLPLKKLNTGMVNSAALIAAWVRNSHHGFAPIW